MKINEIENFPKELLKKKTLNLYKAFIIKDSEDEMRINQSADLLAITEEDAVADLIKNSISSENPIQPNTEISFAVFKVDLKDMENKELLDNGEDYFKDGILFITLKDKIYKIDVYDKIITGYDYNDNVISGITLIDK